jgi:NDP-sugar pyrophosphorylase family protein
VDAVVMAAGEGQRMRPLTERWPKAILPIDGRPVLATLLHELRAAGLPSATIVVGHLGAQVRALVGDGAAFGLPVRYVEQPRADGSADAVRRAQRAGVEPPFLVTAADTVYARGDVAHVRARWEESGAAGALAVRAVAEGDVAGRATVTTENDRLLGIGGPAETSGARTLTAAPLWIVGDEIAGRIPLVAGPPFELADAFRSALHAGEHVLAVEIGATRDVTRPEDVVEENFPYLWR